MEQERLLLGLAVSVGICFLAASIGYFVGDSSVPEWYPGLVKPAWTPPSWLFGPVWMLLYLMMAVAAWLVWWKAGLPAARGALALFLVQLLLNAAWTPIFFGMRSPGGGLVVIALLWVALAATTAAFFRKVPLAGWLLVPYLAWVTYALALNAAIWRLNPA